ncbi:MAG: universal stress protein [Rhizobiales bacterium]|nr:universal stress protein [Hyphomicrobiales bacterium]
MKTFLALIEGSDADAAILEAAHTLAKALDGHVDILHVDLTVLDAAGYAPQSDFARGSGLKDALQSHDAQTTRAAEAARAAFMAFCARYGVTEASQPSAARGVTACWHRESSAEIDQLIATGRHHDAIICGHPASGHAWPRHLIERLLTEAGRPLLLIPKGARLQEIGNVTVCWKEDAASARALSAALPILRRAKSVAIVTVRESPEQTAKSGQHLADQLGWHAIDARAELIWDGGTSAIKQIRAAAAANRADLIVMGAFSHSRTRERLFGGCTQAMLDGADRPVLLLH